MYLHCIIKPLFSFFLCTMLLSGLACEAQSARELLMSARRGNTTAMRKLGKCLYDGRAVPRDLASAAGWWQKAAERGDDDAFFFRLFELLERLELQYNFFAESGCFYIPCSDIIGFRIVVVAINSVRKFPLV